MSFSDTNRYSNSLGIFYMFIAVCCYFLMGLIIKSLPQIATSQLLFFRTWVALLICWVMLKRSKTPPFGKDKKNLIIRGVFGTVSIFGYFISLHNLPFATALIIYNLAPIFTTIFSVIILKEKFKKVQWLFFLMCMVGVVLINGTESENNLEYVLFGIFAALCAGFAYSTIGKIKNSEHPLVIIFYLPLVTAPVILPFVFYQWKNPSPMEWLLLIAMGILVQTAQYFMTMSYQIGENSKVSIVSYFGVILSALGGYFFFQEALSMNEQLGIFVILVGIILNTLIRSRKTLPVKSEIN